MTHAVGRWWLQLVDHGTRRFATLTDSVAAARSNVAAEMFRAITRTVLFDDTAASSLMNRVDDTLAVSTRPINEEHGVLPC